MARRGTSQIIVGELASATNRTETEVRLALGLAVGAAGVAVVLRALRVFVDLDLRPRRGPAYAAAAVRDALGR